MPGKPEAPNPVPVRPPHRRVERKLDENRGQIVPLEQPPLTSDRRIGVTGMMVATHVEAVPVELPRVASRPEPGYL